MTQPNSEEMRSFDRGSGSLQYAVAGDGDPVVFIHGFGLDSDMWAPQWPVVAKTHRAIRYDLRGYGRSSLPEGPYSHVDDLLALMDFLRCRPAHLVGLSMGGRYALRIAQAAPNAVRSLTLADTALDGHAWSDEWLRCWRLMSEAAKSGDIAAARQHWLRHTLFSPALEQAAVAAALEVMVARYSGWHWRHRDPDKAPSPSIAEVLSTLSVPTLMIVGERDLPDFQSIAQRVAKAMPQVQLRTIAGAGHMSNMEAPQEFNRLLLEHMARH
jgi:pimeloyl-ACP methyl ester carboxylesterase